MNVVLQTAVLGIVQGVTEFLPISSSAHLVFAQSVLQVPDAVALPLDLLLHLGTLVAAAWIFRRELSVLVRATFAWVRIGRATAEERRLWWTVLIATVPGVVLGLAFGDALEKDFGSSRVSGIQLILTGVLLISTRFAPSGRAHVGWGRALALGIAQAVAILPGISRSGATIAVGIWSGADRDETARFSFLMSIPIIFGAALLKVPDLLEGGQLAVPAGALVTGFVLSALFGALAIQFLLRVMGRGRFEWFGPYCLVFGGLAAAGVFGA